MWNATRRMVECIVEGITSNNKEVVVKIINSGTRKLWNPDEEALNRCRDFRKLITEALNSYIFYKMIN